jgi:hypothetical protein
MSVIQSKEFIADGKHSAYYGRLRGGNFSRSSSEMTRDETFTLARLQQFPPCDYESYAARGEEFRHRLSSAVLNALKLSDIWHTGIPTARAGESGVACFLSTSGLRIAAANT